MNERIAKLYDQAIIIEDGGDYVCGELDPEKFAELIVRECAGICHKMAEDSDSYVVHDGDTCAEQIKKHFGVEE
jgi:hypothetical protein